MASRLPVILKHIRKFAANLVAFIVLLAVLAFAAVIFAILFVDLPGWRIHERLDYVDPWLIEKYTGILRQNRINAMHALVALAALPVPAALYVATRRGRPVRSRVRAALIAALVSAILCYCILVTYPSATGHDFSFRLRNPWTLFIGTHIEPQSGYRQVTPGPLALKLADRIPINQPDGPKSYRDLMQLMGPEGGREKNQPSDRIRALLEVMERAVRANDMQTASSLLSSDIPFVSSSTAFELRSSGPSIPALETLGGALKTSPDRIVRYAAILAIYETSRDKGLVDMPALISPWKSLSTPAPEFEASAKAWIDWWEKNREQLFTKIQSKDDRLPALPATAP